MTEPSPGGKLERVVTPGRVVVGMIVLFVIALIREPASSPNSAWRFTTYSADPNGARGLYEVAEQLGYKTKRRTTGFRERLDSTATYLVLDPPVELTAVEVGHLLDAVRRGAGLVVIPREGSRIADSLPVTSSGAGSTFAPMFIPLDTTYKSPPEAVVTPMHLWPRAVLRARRPLSDDTVVFLSARPVSYSTKKGTSTPRDGAVVLGMPFGNGRIIAIADPTFLRNDVLRHGNTSLLAFRAIDYAVPDSSSTLVFDEYHHGYGTHANVIGAIGRFLGTSPVGLMLLQLAAAGIVLLAALAPRPLPPVARQRVERRSALEHAEALSAAYEGAGATRTVARRLARGLRRRHPVGTAAVIGEVEYLTLLRERRPAVAAQAALLADACERGIVPARLGELLAATDHIDQALRIR